LRSAASRAARAAARLWRRACSAAFMDASALSRRCTASTASR